MWSGQQEELLKWQEQSDKSQFCRFQKAQLCSNLTLIVFESARNYLFCDLSNCWTTPLAAIYQIDTFLNFKSFNINAQVQYLVSTLERFLSYQDNQGNVLFSFQKFCAKKT